MSWYTKAENLKMNKSKNLCFFVDMDETLLSSEGLVSVLIANYFGGKIADLSSEQRINIMEDNGYEIILDEETTNPIVSKLRPYAKEFLSYLSGLGNIYLCTNATQDYADAALNHFGLSSFFKGKYYRNEIKSLRIKPCDNYFLIDDLPFDQLQGKFQFLGVPTPKWRGINNEEYEKEVEIINQQYGPRHIKVRPYYGENNDTELNSVMGKISQLPLFESRGLNSDIQHKS